MENLTIVKVGGAVVEDPTTLNTLLDDFAAMPGNKLLVHGGGRAADKLLNRLGVEIKKVDGRRITDKETIDVVTMVYAGLVNKNIVAQLQKRGVNALGFTGADLNIILSHKRPVKNIDYGFVGDVDSVQTDVLFSLIEQGAVPVVSPITHDGHGQLLNTNADTIASEVAKAMAAEGYDVTLVYCFEKPGVLRQADDDSSVIPVITADSFRELTADGTISGGMLPKLQNAFAAIRAGVSQVIITNATDLRGEKGTKIINN